MTTKISHSVRLDLTHLESRFSRADLEFLGVDHSGPTFETRVFFNNAEADEDSPTTADTGFVGSFHVFGHGGCYGDEGHCEVPTARQPYDLRPAHPLVPITMTLTVTEALSPIVEKGPAT